jgi:hypothetical protein
LAGLALHTLILQSLVYLDFPLRRTAPWAFAVAAAGVIMWLIRWWRSPRRGLNARKREIAWVVAAGAFAAGVQGTSIAALGSDRYIGNGTIDQVNYVLTAQFLVEERFSTEVSQIGLHPWLYKAIDAKRERLTQCVVLGAESVVAGTDCQRAWAASACFFVALLAMASAGLVRVLGALPAVCSAGVGLWAASTPAVATILLQGFYSQLCTLWVFPALLAICRPSAMPRRAQVVCAAPVLAFLIGGYTEFAPIGIGMVTLLLAIGPGAWWQKALTPAVVLALSAVLLGGYLPFMSDFFMRQLNSAANPEHLAAWASDSGTWRGYGRNFFAITPELDSAGGVVLAIAIAVAAIATVGRRRPWLWTSLLTPAAAAAYLWLQPKLPVYAAYKLGLGLAPVSVGVAAMGFNVVLRRVSVFSTRAVAGVILTLVFVGSASATWRQHRGVIDNAQGNRRELYDKIWRARERAEAHPERVYLVAADDSHVGAWLSYFARESAAYYEPGSLSDRRVPTERVTFRRVPTNEPCWWLDLDRTGSVTNYEPLPRLALVNPVDMLRTESDNLYVLGQAAEIVVERAKGFEPTERRYFLEAGIRVLPPGGECRVELIDAQGALVQALEIGDSPRLAQFAINARGGENRFRLRTTAQSGDRQVVMQSLSIEPRLFQFGRAHPELDSAR